MTTDEPHLLAPSAIGADANLVSKDRLGVMTGKIVDEVITASGMFCEFSFYIMLECEVNSFRVTQPR
ncbi:hypothetical protein BKA82DRAFT_1004961 [Pisolithus tinctorius]|uniref:Uncharacterized protein n=1 Tax=Pisolithus tinctorius Marx 270 TaxID=870435 RepID=A0A0C3IQ80_PISTI|nr:hypothetical protein BKA82DRAFT_1004961 [Pisolithus tinctorius]KIN99112.1 hypothetical protein M404DRAFT_1004961 [Pisolithus tinctorius Marx 270]